MAFCENDYMHNEHLLCHFLTEGRTYCLLSFLLYVLGSVTNPLQQLLSIPSVCCYLCPPFFKK